MELKVLRYIMDGEVQMRSSFKIPEDWTKKVPLFPRKIPNKSLSKSFHPKTDHPKIYNVTSLQCLKGKYHGVFDYLLLKMMK